MNDPGDWIPVGPPQRAPNLRFPARIADDKIAPLVNEHFDPHPKGISKILVDDGTLYNSLVVDHIDVYDTNQVQPSTSALVKLSQIAATTQALDCGVQPAYGCDVRGTFVVSPLGDTLFWDRQSASRRVPDPERTVWHPVRVTTHAQGGEPLIRKARLKRLGG